MAAYDRNEFLGTRSTRTEAFQLIRDHYHHEGEPLGRLYFNDLIRSINEFHAQ
jgi:hypothetical protein